LSCEKLNKNVQRRDGKRDKYILLCASELFQLLMVSSMTPLKKSSQKRTKALPRERVRTRMTKFLMSSVFAVAVAAITPATTSAKAETMAAAPKGMSHTSSQLGKKHLANRNDDSNYFGFRKTPPPGYYGNWVFAPGGNYWDPDYKWRRSLGFWDTNSPACPFRYC
jgi:hypothetical protein